jgi:predicted DNA-binding transcriptional regulator YafY
MDKGRGRTIKRAVQAVNFVTTYSRWTVEDLADELGIHPRNAHHYVSALREVLPIKNYRERVYSHQEGGGMMPALYGVER